MPKQTKRSKKPHDEQRARFELAARELECDEDERAFDEKLKRLVKAKSEKGKPAD